MSIMENPFLKGPEITNLVLQAQRIRESDKIFSDVVDDQGNYYVDFVQQGGGVLGIGLVGYTYILEQAGIRMYSVAGTSAGAINALMIAGLARIGEPVSVRILDLLSQKNLFELLDGSKGVKKMIQKKIEGKSGLFWNLLWNALPIYCSLKNKLGLNPGNDLQQWLEGELQKKDISTYADLQRLREEKPALTYRLNPDEPISPAQISIITSEITTRTRIELPKMAELYWEDLQKTSPADFVHTSMAVPYLFEPVTKKNIPHAGEKATLKWNSFAGYYGKIPDKVRFVDGGLLSNFPINVFHVNRVPTRPTFGARLSTFRQYYAPTDSFSDFSYAILSTMRQIHDYEVILKNPDYRQLICNIDADEEFNWLNFNMSRQRQKELFMLGARKGLEFLQKFDWSTYKETRSWLLRS